MVSKDLKVQQFNNKGCVLKVAHREVIFRAPWQRNLYQLKVKMVNGSSVACLAKEIGPLQCEDCEKP